MEGQEAKKARWLDGSVIPGLTNRLLAIIVAITIACGGLCGVLGYGIGRTQTADMAYMAEKDKLNAELDKVKKKIDDKQYQLSLAERTIAEADSVESGLASKHDEYNKLQQQINALNGQLEEAKKNTVTSGTWQVGKDIEAGTYRANSQVSSQCYWEITVNNGADIVQNDIPGGGYPQVTVSDGQQLKLQDCGTWSRQ